MANADRRKGQQAINALAVGVLAGVALLAALQIAQERAITVAQQISERDVSALDRGEDALVDGTDSIDVTLAARELLPLALDRAREADHVGDTARRALILERALTAIDAAIRDRPHWAEAELVRAYTLAQLRGPETAAAQGAFAASYADGPYLRDSAPWRLGFGVRHWARLGTATRSRLIDEAVWYVRQQPDIRPQLFALLRSSDAYVPFLLRWREMRSRDGDMLRER